MSDEANEKANKTWLYVTGGIMALPLLYVLSVGPMIVLAERGIIPKSAIDSLYRPLERLCIRTDTVEAMVAYIKMWCVLTGTPWPR